MKNRLHFNANLNGLALEGTACGEPFDPSRHQRGIEVKGATYSEVRIKNENGMWMVQCVVDV